MQQSETRNSSAAFKSDFDVLAGLCTVIAFPVVLCTIRFGTWGTRYLDRLAVFGFFWPLVFAAFYGPHPQLGSLILFWYLSIVLLLVHRVRGVQLRRRGYSCHSQYWGQTWFERGSDFLSQRKARHRISLIALIVGFVFFLVLLKPLGAMFVLGALAKLITDSLWFQAVEARLRQMEDARIENEFYIDLYRQRHGNQ